MEARKERARADSAGNDTTATPSQAKGTPSQPQPPSAQDVAKYLQFLGPKIHLKLLTDAGIHHPDVFTAIKVEYDKVAAQKDATMYCFDDCISKADHEINIRFNTVSGSKHYYRDKVWGVANRIREILKDIVARVTVILSSETKFNALKAICRIFEIVLQSRNLTRPHINMIGEYLLENNYAIFHWGYDLMAVVEKFNEEEQETVRGMIVPREVGDMDGPETLWLDDFARVSDLGGTEECVKEVLRMKQALRVLKDEEVLGDSR